MRISEKFLHSKYIIDGVAQEATAFELLENSMIQELRQKLGIKAPQNSIVDESIDPSPRSMTFLDEDISVYFQKLPNIKKLSTSFADFHTKQKIANALIQKIWINGSFKLANLCLRAKWTWNEKNLGNMAALYKSFSAFGDYVYDLDVKISDIKCNIADNCEIEIEAELNKEICDGNSEDLHFKEIPYEINAWTDGKRACSEIAVDEGYTWLLYIPFDTCEPRLGGSLLSQEYDKKGGTAPQLQHPEYFVDCYEVIRELVEDRILLAGVEVGEGGLARAIQRMDCGLNIELSGLTSSFPQSSKTQILFSEIPGVLLQIRDIDYDYVDGQLLLQDVAYYPIGHPKFDTKEINFKSPKDVSLTTILDALFNQASEGED